MRITKKFTGASCIGKRVFHPLELTSENEATIKQARATLQDLERQWLAKLEEQKRDADRKVRKGGRGGGLSGDTELDGEAIGATGSVTMGWLRQAQEALKRDVPLEEVERLLGTGSMICLQYGIRVKNPSGGDDEDPLSQDGDAMALAEGGPATETTQGAKERGLWDCVEAVTVGARSPYFPI